MINIDKLEKMKEFPSKKDYLILTLKDFVSFSPFILLFFFIFSSFLIAFSVFVLYFIFYSLYFYRLDKKIFEALRKKN